MTTLAGKLPKGDRNGLAAHTPSFVADPQRHHVVIAVVHTKKITEDTDTGDTIPSLVIDRIERVLPEDSAELEKFMRRALEKRLGVTVLPIDVEDEISRAFEAASTDETTGEIHRPNTPPSDDKKGK